MKTLLLSLITATSFLSASPQAIVFDYGGVMTKEPNREAVVRFVRESLQLSETEFEKANLEKKQALKSGKTDEEFWQDFAKQKGVVLSNTWAQDFKLVMKEAIGSNPDMYALVHELKQKQIPVALLSNIDERLSKLIREFGLYEPFSPCLLSYEIGIEKPDPKIYQILLEKLKLPAADVVFIDDKLENTQKAKEMGIDAILFESPDQLRIELKQRGLL